MTNNTDTYWEANGQSLHTFARSIETIGGMGPPPLRGENVTVPLMPGTRHVDKTPDSNTITLGMWLRGIDPAGGSGAVGSTRAQYMENYNDLVRLLWNAGREFDLRKRFYDIYNSDIVSATARAEYSGGLQPTMIGRSAGRCTVDLTLADPFFYADNLETYPLVNGENVIVVPGNAPTLNMLITINGARINTTVRNLTNDIEFTTPESLDPGDVLEIKPKTFDATLTPSGEPAYDVSSRIINSGAYQWMQLEPGSNTIEVVSNSGIGIISLQFRGAWV